MSPRIDADRPRDRAPRLGLEPPLGRAARAPAGPEGDAPTTPRTSGPEPVVGPFARDWVERPGGRSSAGLGAVEGVGVTAGPRAFAGIGAPGATRSSLLGAPAPSAKPAASAKPGVSGGPSGVGSAQPVEPSGAPMTAAEVSKTYQASASKDLTSPGTLKAMTDEVAKHGDGKPVTKAEVEDVVAKADVKLLTPKDYEALKTATGGARDNPATAAPASSRAAIAKEGPYRLAKRWKMEKEQSSAEPTPEEVERARKELRRIDPGAFEQPPKDVVYVNARYAKAGYQGDPRVTKVAAHEMTHLVLFKHGVPAEVDGDDVHHALTGSLGWNGKPGASGKLIPGETANWSTKPGEGLPPAPSKKPK